MIKIIVPGSDLESALQKAATATGKFDKDEILSHVIFDVSKKPVEILASNRECSVLVPLHVKDIQKAAGDPDKFTVPARKFLAFVQSADDGDIAIEFHPEDNHIKLQANKTTFELQSLDPDSFFDFRESLKESEAQFDIGVDTLVYGLETCQTFMANSDTKQNLNLVEFSGGRFVAGDGKKLMMVNVGTEGSARFPKESIKEAVSFLKASAKTSRKVKVLQSMEHTFLKTEKGDFFGLFLTDAEFPVEVVDKHVKETENAASMLKIDRKYLEIILERMKIALDGGDSTITFRVYKEENQWMLDGTAYSSRGLPLRDPGVKVVWTGTEEATFSFNYQNLLDVIKQMTDMVVSISLHAGKHMFRIDEDQVFDESESRHLTALVTYVLGAHIPTPKEEKEEKVEGAE